MKTPTPTSSCCQEKAREVTVAIEDTTRHPELADVVRQFGVTLSRLAEDKLIDPRTVLAQLGFIIGSFVLVDARNDPQDRERIADCCHYFEHVMQMSVEVCRQAVAYDPGGVGGTVVLDTTLVGDGTAVQFHATFEPDDEMAPAPPGTKLN